MPNSRHVTASVLSLALSISGCLSGQTGSPECVGPTSCVCDTLYGGGALLRVHAEMVDGGRLVAVVDEVLGSVYGGADVRSGDRVGGELTVQRPCAAEDVAPLEGAELFALYYPSTQAASLSCDGKSEEACAEERSAALLSGGFSFVVPWAEELDFGAGHQLPLEDLAALESPEACWERFPLGEAPPCDDTIESGCRLSHTPSSPFGSPWAGVLFGAALLAWARRARRPATPPVP